MTCREYRYPLTCVRGVLHRPWRFSLLSFSSMTSYELIIFSTRSFYPRCSRFLFHRLLIGFIARSASIHCHFNPDRFVICSNNSCHNLILNLIHVFLTGDINYETKFILIYEIWWNRFLFYFTKKIRINISANYLHLEGQSVENEKRSISWNYVLYRSSL